MGQNSVLNEQEPLQILFLLNGLYVGGAEKHTLSLIERLPRSRFECSVVYLKPIDALRSQFVDAKPATLECLDVKNKLDIQAVRKLAGWCDQRKVDVIVAVDPYPMLVALMAKLFCKESKPKVLEILHITDLPTTALEWQYQLVYRWLFRLCDEILFVSRLQMEHWQRRGLNGKKVGFIHNGVDETLFIDHYSPQQKLDFRRKAGFEEFDFVIAICASLRPEKRHEDLIDTIASLKRQGIRAKALIIGDGPRRTQIESHIDSVGVSDDAYFTGMISDVKPWISCADCVVLTSHSETFSIAALEAMSLGKPVIATRIGGAEEQISNGVNGYLFVKGDLTTFESHLTTVAASGTASSLGLQARQRVVQEFTLDVMVRKYADTLEALCGV